MSKKAVSDPEIVCIKAKYIKNVVKDKEFAANLVKCPLLVRKNKKVKGEVEVSLGGFLLFDRKLNKNTHKWEYEYSVMESLVLYFDPSTFPESFHEMTYKLDMGKARFYHLQHQFRMLQEMGLQPSVPKPE